MTVHHIAETRVTTLGNEERPEACVIFTRGCKRLSTILGAAISQSLMMVEHDDILLTNENVSSGSLFYPPSSVEFLQDLDF